ncbi:MAG: CbtB-domain containing protein [Actinobacteria bacterium]|nr:CbtB-domain containing protein [Actinomycetota bacterium]
MSQLAVRLRPVSSLTLLLPVLMAVALLFAVAFDQGQLAQVVKAAAGDSTVHEFFHDTRHMLGFPCH